MKKTGKRKLIVILLFSGLLVMFNACEPKGLSPGEGFVDVNGGKIWYRINGGGTNTPILLLHGGPGSSSLYLDPLKPLSKDRPVVFIDQLGCGRSTRITDTTLMTIEQYVEQVEKVRIALNLKDFYLYGHSWGTMLGIDYYLKYPKEVRSLIFHSPLFSTEMWIKDADTLIATLPDSVQRMIRESERNKTYNSDEYKKGMEIFYSQFLRRKDRPKSLRDSLDIFRATNVYEFMWGSR